MLKNGLTRGQALIGRACQWSCKVKIPHLITSVVLLWCFGCPIQLSHAATNSNNHTDVLERGIVVEWLTQNSQAEKAGIRQGDILLSWTRGDLGGEFESPFDLSHVRFEQASRGIVRIEGVRGTEKHSWLLGSDTWGIAGRPNLIKPLSTIYQEGQQLAQASSAEEAAGRWRIAATMAEHSSVSWLSSWFLMRVAQVLFSDHEWDPSDSAYGEAIERAKAADPVVRAELFRQRGSGFSYRDDFANAEKWYLRVLLEWQKLGTETMSVSTSLNQIGSITLVRGDLRKAEGYFRQALAIEERLAPKSVQVAWSLSNLGALHQGQGNLDAAEKVYRLALIHEETYFPGSRTLVQTIRNLGILAQQRGDLPRAEAHYRRALAIAEKLDDSNLDEVAAIVGYLAECVLDQGHPEDAEEYERRALAIREKMSPYSLDVALSFRNLGKIARIRGDLPAADNYYQQALTIGERLAPSSLETARFLIGLGYVARDRGGFD